MVTVTSAYQRHISSLNLAKLAENVMFRSRRVLKALTILSTLSSLGLLTTHRGATRSCTAAFDKW